VETKSSTEIALDPGLLKAVSHPLRLDILRRLNERTASPAELSRQMGASLGNVSHHVKVLLEAGCVELVSTRQVRGATEHFYRGTAKANVTDHVSELLPQECREGIRDKMLRVIFDRLGEAISGGTIDKRSDRHISWMALSLDEKGWEELISSKARQLERETEIEADAANRIADGAESFKVFTAGIGIELPDG
jgi:DNA-binding transcriptional ArsR family regulator